MLARFTQIDYDREVAMDEDARPTECRGLPESSAMRMERRLNLFTLCCGPVISDGGGRE